MAELQFPLALAEGAAGGPEFSTIIISQSVGKEQRVARMVLPRRRFAAGFTPATRAELESVIELFVLAQGRLHILRFRDWLDFYVGGSYTYGQGFTHGTPHTFAASDGTDTYQLQKIYALPNNETLTRPIYKPVDPVRIYIDGTDVTATDVESIDYTTGQVVLTAPVAEGHSLGWSGMFDVPCRFDTDAMGISLLTAYTGEWIDVKLIEELNANAVNT